MADVMADVMRYWQQWFIGLLALPLLFRTLAWAAEIALLARRGRQAEISAMLSNHSQTLEWESRVMTTVVALAAILIGLGAVHWASMLLMGWMVFRWARFTKDMRALAKGLVAMAVVGWIASVAGGAL